LYKDTQTKITKLYVPEYIQFWYSILRLQNKRHRLHH